MLLRLPLYGRQVNTRRHSTISQVSLGAVDIDISMLSLLADYGQAINTEKSRARSAIFFCLRAKCPPEALAHASEYYAAYKNISLSGDDD